MQGWLLLGFFLKKKKKNTANIMLNKKMGLAEVRDVKSFKAKASTAFSH